MQCVWQSITRGAVMCQGAVQYRQESGSKVLPVKRNIGGAGGKGGGKRKGCVFLDIARKLE